MLSLKKCREILGKDCSMSDQELEKLRTQLYQLGGIAIQVAIPPEKAGGAEEPLDPPGLPKEILRSTGRRRGRRARREIYCGRFN